MLVVDVRNIHFLIEEFGYCSGCVCGMHGSLDPRGSCQRMGEYEMIGFRVFVIRV